MSDHQNNNPDQNGVQQAELKQDELKQEDQGFFYRPAVIKTIINSLYGVCALLIVIDLFATFDIGLHRHMVHPFEKVPGFYAIYGFVGCVVLVLIAKEMRKVLMRKEDYYDDMD